MKVYSYIVTHDSGFSPNPFHGVCTLACCKPVIRRVARPGDLIVGLSTRGERVVYAMQVRRVLDFGAYWNDPLYSCKRADMTSPLALLRRGDNIYEPCGIGEFRQLPSRHANPDGTEDLGSKATDLSGLYVIVAERYTYFGEDGPPLPPQFAFLRAGRGHRCRFTEEEVAQVSAWFEELPPGVLGRPARWPSSDDSWQQG
jgi:hypothetical protein